MTNWQEILEKYTSGERTPSLQMLRDNERQIVLGDWNSRMSRYLSLISQELVDSTPNLNITFEGFQKIADLLPDLEFVNGNEMPSKFGMHLISRKNMMALYVEEADVQGVKGAQVSVLYTPRSFAVFQQVKKLLMDYPLVVFRPEKPRINLIGQNGGGYYTTEVALDKDYLNLYPEELITIKSVVESDGSGALILHGPPGTGKSSLIAQVAQECFQHKFFYISAHLSSSLDSPHFMEFLLKTKNAIYILEDAENVVMKREMNSHSPLSAILNLSDGLLGAALQTKFILTFNTQIQNIDEAILRSGRLRYFKEFERLSPEAAAKIAKMAGKSLENRDNHSLAEIFNGNPLAVGKKKKAQLGFCVDKTTKSATT